MDSLHRDNPSFPVAFSGDQTISECFDPSNAKRKIQQARLNEKYRYIAELRYEIEQLRAQINSIVPK